jgi:inhibitor of KinA sporulation pathway (predicted exonuclease)
MSTANRFSKLTLSGSNEVGQRTNILSRNRIALDQIVVIDIEATCWRRKPPRGQKNEIIEIGVCMLDIQTGERLERESILVKPIRSKVSGFCTKLTTLTQQQVEQGVAFAEACKILVKKFNSSERTWASYGEYDRTMFEEQCADLGVSYPFSSRHINVKNIFAVFHGLEKEVGMANALELRGMALEGTHHRGGDDAWNTAKLLSELLILKRTALRSVTSDGS